MSRPARSRDFRLRGYVGELTLAVIPQQQIGRAGEIIREGERTARVSGGKPGQIREARDEA